MKRIEIRDKADMEYLADGLMLLGETKVREFTEKARIPTADRFALTIELRELLTYLVGLAEAVQDGMMSETDTQEGSSNV